MLYTIILKVNYFKVFKNDEKFKANSCSSGMLRVFPRILISYSRIGLAADVFETTVNAKPMHFIQLVKRLGIKKNLIDHLARKRRIPLSAYRFSSYLYIFISQCRRRVNVYFYTPSPYDVRYTTVESLSRISEFCWISASCANMYFLPRVEIGY